MCLLNPAHEFLVGRQERWWVLWGGYEAGCGEKLIFWKSIIDRWIFVSFLACFETVYRILIPRSIMGSLHTPSDTQKKNLRTFLKMKWFRLHHWGTWSMLTPETADLVWVFVCKHCNFWFLLFFFLHFIIDRQGVMLFKLPALGRLSTKTKELGLLMKQGVIFRCPEFESFSSRTCIQGANRGMEIVLTVCFNYI